MKVLLSPQAAQAHVSRNANDEFMNASRVVWLGVNLRKF